jgi:hypothetical protein
VTAPAIVASTEAPSEDVVEPTDAKPAGKSRWSRIVGHIPLIRRLKKHQETN